MSLKVYKQKAMKFNGLTYRARDVIADELYLDRLTKVPEAIVVSSWRSLAEQKVMVANGKSKTLNSNHRRGMACDIVNWNAVGMQAKLREVGLMNDITWDRNHFAYDSESKATRFPLIDVLPKKLEEYKKKDINKKPEKVDIPVIISTVTVTPKIDASELLGVDVPESVIATLDYAQKPVESSTIELGKIEIPKNWVERILLLIKQLLKL